jgi:hypothetical protein
MKAEEEFSLKKKRAVVDIKNANAAGTTIAGQSVYVRQEQLFNSYCN